MEQLVTDLRGTGNKFVDNDFQPIISSIYTEVDKVAIRDSVCIENLKWFRPEQIAIKSDLVGFYDINREKATPAELENLFGLELADGGRICYGQTLENRWFLNALTMVASEERQLDLLTCEFDLEVVKMRQEFGIYVFRFFKMYDPYYVIVDDRIPCMEMSDGRPIPFFSKCANPHLFWVSLVEKAYAKLHGRYFALNGGTTDEALEDLTGVPIENCFIDNGTSMTDKTTLFNCIKTICYNHCVIGCKLDFEMFQSTDPLEKQKVYSKAKSLGLQPFHMYTILDARTVFQKLPGGKPVEVNLIRLQNPWSEALEWRGKCCDMDDGFWTQETKDQFNSLDVLKQAGGDT